MRFFVLSLLTLCLTISASAQDQSDNLMPRPTRVVRTTDRLPVTKDFSIAVTGRPGPRVYQEATRTLRRLDNRTGLFFRYGNVTDKGLEFVEPERNGPRSGMQWVNIPEQSATLVIDVGRPGELKLGEDETYRLTVNRSQVRITAPTDLGALHGLETIQQLLSTDASGYYFPGIEITDTPRFAWRGLLIDVCLHWMPMEVILRTLDLMASVKMNVLHLHLSEDQMFGIESKVFPRLTQVGAEGNFFTQDEMKKIIAYADQRGIRIVPEFDVPGHCTAMLRAYPELAAVPRDYGLQRYFGVFDPALDVTKPYTYEFLDKLFGEMAALFPDEYFHIGGDENTGEDWKRSPGISAYMQERGMKDYRELQTEFMKKLLPIVQKHGKKMMGWDEIYYPGVPKEIMIHSWRGHESLSDGARKGYTGLLSTGYYIDLIQSTEFHYLNDPVPPGTTLTPAEQKLIVGGEATMWTEHVTPETVDSRIWPRTAAIAERLWSEQSVRDVDDMYRRLERIGLLLEGQGSTHLRNREVLMRRLANGSDTRALEVLVSAIEPLKIYQRNAGDTMYNVFSPYTKLADAATPDQAVARQFRRDVQEWLSKPNTATGGRIRERLTTWKNNHTAFTALVKNSPVLEEATELSQNLSWIAAIGLEAMDRIEKNKSADRKWKDRCMEAITAAKQQGGRCELQVTDAIASLVAGKTE